MGIVTIEDELHDQLRRASKVTCRSINAQAAFWIRIGMMAETSPGLSFAEIIAREFTAAGVAVPPPPGLHEAASRPLGVVPHDQAA
jgi:hypothetical protein